MTCLVVLGILVGSMVGVVGSAVAPASAADLGQFDAGNIISDPNFYDRAAMSEAEIQSFLVSKVGSCLNSNCLAVHREDTSTRTLSYGTCSTYVGGAQESAARIIYKVQAACGISARVILVTLQKEQGLITKRAPSDAEMRSAMGYGCPDTSQCDAAYYGFYNQVLSAARQLTWYGNSGGSFTWIHVGRYNNILYNPDATCGTKSVLIQNRATAALYYYTPYTPDPAALAAGYGTGGSCSSYGNRNFFSFYSDWFGSPKGFAVTGPIGTYYTSLGGAQSFLAYPTSSTMCDLVNSGCWQAFQGGAIYYSPTTGAHAVRPSTVSAWAARGYETGALGFPNTEAVFSNSTDYEQQFEGGTIAVTKSGGAVVTPMDASWRDSLRSNTWLGVNTSSRMCDLINSGCWQAFQNGAVYFSPTTGTHALRSAVFAQWGKDGYEPGVLGYPNSDAMFSNSTDYVQQFEGGSIAWSSSGGAVTSLMPPAWKTAQRGNTWLGKNTTSRMCDLVDNGCWQGFSNGSLYYTAATGAHPIHKEVIVAWGQRGYEAGALGYPTGDPVPIGSSTTDYTQTFQRGVFKYTAAGGVVLVSATDPWLEAVASNPWLGQPLMTKYCALIDSGCWQAFQNGHVYSSASAGVHAIDNAMWAFWRPLGFEAGALGYPTGDRTPIGSSTTDYTQTFQRGVVTFVNGKFSL